MWVSWLKIKIIIIKCALKVYKFDITNMAFEDNLPVCPGEISPA
jgi:hypothetical protein